MKFQVSCGISTPGGTFTLFATHLVWICVWLSKRCAKFWRELSVNMFSSVIIIHSSVLHIHCSMFSVRCWIDNASWTFSPNKRCSHLPASEDNLPLLLMDPGTLTHTYNKCFLLLNILKLIMNTVHCGHRLEHPGYHKGCGLQPCLYNAGHNTFFMFWFSFPFVRLNYLMVWLFLVVFVVVVFVVFIVVDFGML